MSCAEDIAKLAKEFGTHWTSNNTQASVDIPRGPVGTAVDVFDDGIRPIGFDHTLSPHHGAGIHLINRGASSVVIVKIGRRSYVRTNELRHLAGLPASAAREGAA